MARGTQLHLTHMAEIRLQAQRRTLKGRKVGALRRQGLIPGNIYGRGMDSQAVQVETRALRNVLVAAGTSTVVDLQVVPSTGEGDSSLHLVLIENISLHPATGKPLHIDFRQVDVNRPVRAAVPIVLAGEAPGTVRGGVLMQTLDTIEVEALPRELPHELPVDVSVLHEVDSQITVADLRLPRGVTVATDPTTLVVRIVASKLEQEVEAEVAEAEAAAAEAEVAEAPEGAEATEGAEAPPTENES
jgi:large subunit ribosomal protein L25